MKFEIYLAPCMGLGFCIHFEHPVLELVFGPFVIRLGDTDKLDDAEE